MPAPLPDPEPLPAPGPLPVPLPEPVPEPLPGPVPLPVLPEPLPVPGVLVPVPGRPTVPPVPGVPVPVPTPVPGAAVPVPFVAGVHGFTLTPLFRVVGLVAVPDPCVLVAPVRPPLPVVPTDEPEPLPFRAVVVGVELPEPLAVVPPELVCGVVR